MELFRFRQFSPFLMSIICCVALTLNTGCGDDDDNEDDDDVPQDSSGTTDDTAFVECTNFVSKLANCLRPPLSVVNQSTLAAQKCPETISTFACGDLAEYYSCMNLVTPVEDCSQADFQALSAQCEPPCAGVLTADPLNGLLCPVDMSLSISDLSTESSVEFSTTSLSFEHVVGSSPCPQPVGKVTITNRSKLPISFTATSPTSALTVSPGAFSLNPGDAVEIEVQFSCTQQVSFEEAIRITGTATPAADSGVNEELVVVGTITPAS